MRSRPAVLYSMHVARRPPGRDVQGQRSCRDPSPAASMHVPFPPKILPAMRSRVRFVFGRAQSGGEVTMTKRPITLLVRTVNGKWARYGTYATADSAEAIYETRIRGRGITGWAWWGPTSEAKKMLSDPSYDPDAPQSERGNKP